MKNINVIYDYSYNDETETIDIFDDVDIISVPNMVADNLDNVVQKFFDWTNTVDSGCWKQINNKVVCCVETSDFIRWLNRNYFYCEEKESTIIEQHTKFNPEYPCAEF